MRYAVSVNTTFCPREGTEDERRPRLSTHRQVIDAWSLEDAQAQCDVMNRRLAGSREDISGTTNRSYEVVGILHANDVNGYRKVVLTLSDIVAIVDDWTSAPSAAKMAAE